MWGKILEGVGKGLEAWGTNSPQWNAIRQRDLEEDRIAFQNHMQMAMNPQFDDAVRENALKAALKTQFGKEAESMYGKPLFSPLKDQIYGNRGRAYYNRTQPKTDYEQLQTYYNYRDSFDEGTPGRKILEEDIKALEEKMMRERFPRGEPTGVPEPNEVGTETSETPGTSWWKRGTNTMVQGLKPGLQRRMSDIKTGAQAIGRGIGSLGQTVQPTTAPGLALGILGGLQQPNEDPEIRRKREEMIERLLRR